MTAQTIRWNRSEKVYATSSFRLRMTLLDPQGHRIRLPAERWGHIVEDHPDMIETPEAVGEALKTPDAVRRSNSDPDTVRLYYKRFPGTVAGNKWVCVVVKYLEGDAFVLTAYPTDNIKRGEET